MKNILVLFALLTAALNCSAERILTDETGRTVTVPDHPHRIICLVPSFNSNDTRACDIGEINRSDGDGINDELVANGFAGASNQTFSEGACMNNHLVPGNFSQVHLLHSEEPLTGGTPETLLPERLSPGHSTTALRPIRYQSTNAMSWPPNESCK